ncbi:MAG: hypothetical protein ACRYHQ_05465 [Janthinobacterium lividum]
MIRAVAELQGDRLSAWLERTARQLQQMELRLEGLGAAATGDEHMKSRSQAGPSLPAMFLFAKFGQYQAEEPGFQRLLAPLPNGRLGDAVRAGCRRGVFGRRPRPAPWPGW